MPLRHLSFKLPCLLGLACALPLLTVARPPLTGPVSQQIDEPASAAQGPGFDSYFTGFEPEEGFIPRDPDFPDSGFSGWIDGQPWNPIPQLNWGTTTNPNRSDREGHIETLHPFGGLHHLRFSHHEYWNPPQHWHACQFGCPLYARLPASVNVVEQPIGPYRVEGQVALGFPDGPNFRIQPQSNTQGLLSASVLFSYAGSIYVLDDVCDTEPLNFVPTGFFWDTTGAYQSMSIEFDPCANTVDYRYGEQLIYSSCTYAGTALEQFLVFADYYPFGGQSHVDLDNLSLTRGEPCCGNGNWNSNLGEECDGADAELCPGLCQGDCRCDLPHGACCDINGANLGCREDVLANLCNQPDETWHQGATCATAGCACIPFCAGRECGNDGCDGQCGSCSDGDVCNGLEACNINGLCIPGVDLACSDDNVCNGVETCEPSAGCLPGTPLVCSDGMNCNGFETCHPADGCRPGTPTPCGDGLFCNGAEFCSETYGCVSDSPPCDAGEFCDETANECLTPTIPTISIWGLATLVLLLLIGAKIRFGKTTSMGMRWSAGTTAPLGRFSDLFPAEGRRFALANRRPAVAGGLRSGLLGLVRQMQKPTQFPARFNGLPCSLADAADSIICRATMTIVIAFPPNCVTTTPRRRAPACAHASPAPSSPSRRPATAAWPPAPASAP